jgi:HPr kinase/phosphorylase
MNRLAAILPVEQVLVGVDATSKKRAFEEAGLLFESLHGLSRALVTDSLFARERLGSTGLGHGVAIPHGRIKGLKAPMAAVFQLEQAIGFDAPDEQAVKLLIFLLVPEAATQKHLEILSEIAEILSNASTRDNMISSATASSLHNLISKWLPAKYECCSLAPHRNEVEMKPTAVSADALFEDHRGKLKWQWIAGLGASERRFDEVAVRAARSGADLVGYLNYIHPYRVQILGEREVSYLMRGSEEDCLRRVSRIVTLEPPVLVLADGQAAPEALLKVCERAQIPMFSTPESSAFVIDVLRAYLSKHFADRTTMHGVFMDILGLGVLITGESGLGKSELGLELISRGNGLVADDAVDLFRINQTTIEARCPELLQNLLEVRGIGLLDIRAIFGETAVRRKMRLKLIVHLVRHENFERDYERIPTETLTQDVLGIPVRKVVIQVVAGRNIAVLVEAAVRNTILQMRGIDTYQDFIARQREAIG